MKEIKDITIGRHTIGAMHRPYVIAEMSGNHNQSLERALAIVDAAATAGVQALKLQTYTADTITLDVEEGDFVIGDAASLWKGRSLHSLYKEAYTPWDWHAPIFKRCHDLGLDCFSTPFDESAVDFLETLDVPVYKIASFENIHHPLLKKVASTGKPVIMSTGMASISELAESVEILRRGGVKDLVLLKCTSTYPATPENTNIMTIPHMQQLFDCPVGLSDHTMGTGVSVAAVALGARVIEKHFTLKRADGGVDSAFSLEPEELRSLVVETERAWHSLGAITYGPTEKEKQSLQWRRSLYVGKNMKAGEIFTPDNLRIVRPGLGLPPKFYEVVLGRAVKKDVKKGTPVSWEIV